MFLNSNVGRLETYLVMQTVALLKSNFGADLKKSFPAHLNLRRSCKKPAPSLHQTLRNKATHYR